MSVEAGVPERNVEVYERKPSFLRERLPAILILGSPVAAALMTGGTLTGERYIKLYVAAWAGEVIVSINGAIAVAGASVGGMLVRGKWDSKLAVGVACAVYGATSYRFFVELLAIALWHFR